MTSRAGVNGFQFSAVAPMLNVPLCCTVRCRTNGLPIVERSLKTAFNRGLQLLKLSGVEKLRC